MSRPTAEERMEPHVWITGELLSVNNTTGFRVVCVNDAIRTAKAHADAAVEETLRRMDRCARDLVNATARAEEAEDERDAALAELGRLREIIRAVNWKDAHMYISSGMAVATITVSAEKYEALRNAVDVSPDNKKVP